MKPFALSILVTSLVLVAVMPASLAQRGGGGRGGGVGGGARPGGTGGARPGGFTSPAHSAPSQPTPALGARSSGVGPGGGTWQSGSRSGQAVTPGGAQIQYKGAAVSGTGAGGATGGRYVGGVQVTTPGGETINRVGRGGAATGPGGVSAGHRGSITQATGPGGTLTGASRGGIAVGPGGAVGGRAGVAVGPGGVAAGRGGVAVGTGGAVAGRSGVAVTPHGTYYRSAAAVRGQGVYVRAGAVPYRGYFTRSWYTQYPGAWFAAGWAANTAWRAATWGAVAATGGYPAAPANYDYGSSVVYEGNTVYIDGEPAGTTEAYAQEATTIADAGRKAQPAKEEEWLPLGVFAMVQGEETTSYNIFQLALDQDGLIRGNYYNTLTDATEPVYGSVNKRTQRAAWTVGDKKKPVYEAGIGNLTQDEATMLVHYSKERSQQFTLFRLEQPKEADSNKVPDQK